MFLVVIRVGVPGLVVVRGVINRDEADARFDEAAGEQAGLGESGFAVHFFDVLGFLRDVEDVHRFALHLERDLHRFDFCFEFGRAAALIEVLLIDRSEQIELFSLL